MARRRYSGVAIILHWLIAALILINIRLGLQYETLRGFAQFQTLQWHKSVGITILLLTVLRLAWRLVHPPPPFPAAMPRWQRRAALWTHRAFYAVMLGLPLTGWVIVSASPTNIRTVLYNTLPWPHLGFVHGWPLETRKAIEAGFVVLHHQLGILLYGLLSLHVAAALKHHFGNRDDTLAGILPRLPRGEG